MANGFRGTRSVQLDFYQIPHLSLGAELIQTFEDRTKIFAYSAFIQAMSVAVAYGLITAYFSGPQKTTILVSLTQPVIHKWRYPLPA